MKDTSTTARVAKLKGKFRVVQGASKKAVKNVCDKPVDGGGYDSGSAADKHAQAYNWSKG